MNAQRRQTAAICVALSLLVTLPSEAQQAGDECDVQGIYLRGYILVQEAEKLENQGNRAEAYFKYMDASDMFESVARDYPAWKPTMVAFRRNLVRKKMDETRVYTDPQFRTVLRALWEKKQQEHAAAVSESPEGDTADTGGESALEADDLPEGNEIGRLAALNLGYSFCVIHPHKGHLLKIGDRVLLSVNRGRPPAVTGTVTMVDHQHAIAEFPSEAGPQINVRAPVYEWLPGVGLPQFRGVANAGRKSDGMDGRQAAADGLPKAAAKAANAGPASVPTPGLTTNHWRKPPTLLNSPTEDSEPRPYLEPVVPECIGLEFLPAAGGARLTWFSQTDRTLRIEVSSDLTTWIAAGSATELSPGVFELTDLSATGTGSRFYRAVVP